jgi:hypothetical protein
LRLGRNDAFIVSDLNVDGRWLLGDQARVGGLLQSTVCLAIYGRPFTTSVDLKDKKGGQMFDSIVDDLVDYVEDYTTLKAMLDPVYVQAMHPLPADLAAAVASYTVIGDPAPALVPDLNYPNHIFAFAATTTGRQCAFQFVGVLQVQCPGVRLYRFSAPVLNLQI